MSYCYAVLICLNIIIRVWSFLNMTSFNCKTVGWNSVDKIYHARVRFHLKCRTWFISLFFSLQLIVIKMRAVTGAKEHRKMRS